LPRGRVYGIAVISILIPLAAAAQSATTLAALRGLAPVAALPQAPLGKAALAANLVVTGAIQTGSLRQPTLLPYAAQQQQALRDAFVTGANVSQLADGLGSKLGGIYQSIAHYSDVKTFTSISASVYNLLAYTNEITASDSSCAKYVFANATLDGKTSINPAAAAILAQSHDVTDVFGKAYGHVAGSAGADAYGDSRPFQTEPRLVSIAGPDFFGTASNSIAWLKGPAQDLTNSPSFPSGHTTYGTAGSVLLAILVPQRYREEITRGAEFGNDRVILGAHYAMDVIAGRTLALYDVAHLLANNPAYVGQPSRRAAAITDYQAAVHAARADLTAALESRCGATIDVCAATDAGRFHNPAANAALYRATLSYGLPVVYPAMAHGREDVAKIAPEAGYLLTTAFPSLTLAKADAILTSTEAPGGGFLDNGSAFGLYSRLDLYAAATQAATLPRVKHLTRY
jgi:membrane-associated phospholipid phosphatase